VSAYHSQAYSEAAYRMPPSAPSSAPAATPVWTNQNSYHRGYYGYEQATPVRTNRPYLEQNYAAFSPAAPQGYSDYAPSRQEELPSFLRGQRPSVKRSMTSKETKHLKDHQAYFWKSVELFQKNWYQQWIKQELTFSMNKISITGLIFGLMLLGSIFFLIGFLVAVNLYTPKAVDFQERSLVPSSAAVMSGRVAQPMQANALRENTGSLNSAARMPSSTLQTPQIHSSFSKSRVPSFQMSTGS